MTRDRMMVGAAIGTLLWWACASAPKPVARPVAPPPPPDRAPASAPAPAAPSTLAELLAADVAGEAGFAWSIARPLTWTDFQGPPAAAGLEAAKSTLSLYYGWKCRGSAFEFRVIAAFLPRQSWVKPGTVRDSAESRRVLRHEQTHFNVTEVYARRMRRAFAELAEPCDKSDSELTRLAQAVLREEKATQRRYDDETGHGVEAARQAAWNRDIDQQLAALGRYSR